MSGWARAWWCIVAALAYSLAIGSAALAAVTFYVALVLATLHVCSAGFRPPDGGGRGGPPLA